MKKQIEKIRQNKIDYVIAEKKKLFKQYGISYCTFHGVDALRERSLENPKNPDMAIIVEYFSDEVIESLPEDTVMGCRVVEHDTITVTNYDINDELYSQYQRIDSAFRSISESDDSLIEQLFDVSMKLHKKRHELAKLQSLVRDTSDILNKAKMNSVGVT